MLCKEMSLPWLQSRRSYEVRDIGYATALDELIDNSVQAGATRVDVAFGYGRSSTAKPDQIAVLDNGHGMDPEMIRASVMWGGTHREGDRLRAVWIWSAQFVLSQGRRFTVYSVPAGGTLHKVTLDIEELGAGNYQTNDGESSYPLMSKPTFLSGSNSIGNSREDLNSLNRVPSWLSTDSID